MNRMISVKFLVYCFVIFILSVIIQSNMTESLGIPFFVIMITGGTIFQVMKKHPKEYTESKMQINISYTVIRDLTSGFAAMIFAVFLYLHIISFARGESLLIWLGITWVVMLIGIVKILFVMNDINALQQRENDCLKNKTEFDDISSLE